MSDTEPLDIDALIEDADDYATALDYAGRSEGVRLIRGLIAEVRRLRAEGDSDGSRLRELRATVTAERNDFAKQLGIEPEWTEADV